MSTPISPCNHQLKTKYDQYVRYLFIASAYLVTLISLSIIVFVGQQGLRTFKEVSPGEFFFSANWDPLAGQYGALSFIVGSLATTVLAVFLAAPLGVGGAIFLAKIAPPRLRQIMRPVFEFYAAIPSVVFGFIGLTVLVPFIRDRLAAGSGFGLLTAATVLAVMLLPTIICISEEALRSVPRGLEEGSLALGATRWQTITGVIVPAAMPGILTSIILAMARAIGETVAVKMVIGNSPLLVKSLFTPTATLTSEIALETGNTPFGSTWGNSLFLMALVLLIIALLMIIMIRHIAPRRVI